MAAINVVVNDKYSALSCSRKNQQGRPPFLIAKVSPRPPAQKSKTPAQGRRFTGKLKRILRFSYHNYSQLSEHIAVNLEVHFVLTQSAQNAFWQTNFALGNVNTSRSYCVSDVTGTDRAEQFTFVACFRRDGNRAQFVDAGCASFSGAQNVS